eukprot:3929523-Rhodomonas_salina.3
MRGARFLDLRFENSAKVEHILVHTVQLRGANVSNDRKGAVAQTGAKKGAYMCFRSTLEADDE